MVRAQARAGRPPRRSSAGSRVHRRLDGRHAGARVGRSCIPERVRSLVADRHVRAGHRAADRLGRDRPAGHPRSTPSWRGGDYYDAEPGRRPPRGPGPRPHDRPDHVPHRRRVHRPLRPRAGRADSTTASTCGSASRSSATSTTTATSSSAASTPTATCVLSKAMDLHDVGRGRGGLEAALARITVPDAGRSASPATCSTRPTSSARSAELLAPPRRRRPSYVEIDSPTATTPS